jgi:hypothetical protein
VGNEAINTSSDHSENCCLNEFVINYSGFKNLTLSVSESVVSRFVIEKPGV